MSDPIDILALASARRTDASDRLYEAYLSFSPVLTTEPLRLAAVDARDDLSAVEGLIRTLGNA